jgi:PAS domain S-box-containing protein
MIGERDGLLQENARLRQEIEELRRQLREAEATIRDTRPLIEGPPDEASEEVGAAPPRREEQPVAAEALARSVLEQAADAVVVCDAAGRVVRASRSARDLCKPGPLQRPFADAFAFVRGADSGPGAAECITRALRGQEVRGVELHMAAGDGRRLDVLLSARPLIGPDGRPAGAVVNLTDFTERKRGEDRLAAQYAVSRVLAAAASTDEAMPRVLEAVGRRLDWHAGAFWSVDAATGVLRPTAFWQAAATRFPVFEAMTRGQTLTPGADLPGRVWTSGEPWWVADLPRHPELPRAAIAAREGLRGAYAFPARLGDEVLGVVEFFCADVRPPDDDVLQAMAALGQQIGQFLRRVRAEDERRRLLRDLEAERARLHTVLDQMPVGVILAEAPSGRVTFTNQQVTRMLGAPPPQVAAVAEYDRYPTLRLDGRAYRGEEWPLAHSVRDGRFVAEEEMLFVRPDGGRGVLRMTCAPIRDASGRPVAGVAAFIDVTEHRRAQAALEQAVRDKDEALALLDTLLDRAPVGFAFMDPQLRFRRVNSHLAELHGVPAADHIGRTGREILPALAVSVQPLLAEVRDSGTGVTDQEVTGPTRRQDGRPGHWLVSGYPVRRSTGELLGVGVVVVDFTERKRMEEALREGEARFRQLAESLPQLIWTSGPDGACDYLSRQWHSYTGRPEVELLGDGWLSVMHPADASDLARKWHAHVADGTLFDTDARIRGADGRYRWFKARAIPLHDAAGRVVKWFGSHTDIETQKTAEETLREADRRKDEFLAMLSHELRNPLAPIRNALEVIRLRGGERRAVLRQAWDMVERQVEQLSRLVDDLLDVSRITRGKITLRQEPVEVAAFVDRAVETSRPVIEARRHQLEVVMPPEPLWVRGDPTRLAQVLLNLLNNAAKYTDEGGRVSLTVQHERCQVVLRVRDNGIGIPPEMLPHVFELFTQVDPTLERAQGGLGIGLTLVRQLVMMHGGTVEPHSPGRGQGSEFVVRLPLLPGPPAPAELPAPPPVVQPATRACRVLVVDDNRDAAESLVMLLRLVGHDASLALDGPTALRAAAAAPPDVVLCDIGMPGMNGYEVARRLRGLTGVGRPLLVAVTGFGAAEDRRRTAEAGFDAHLVKPVEPEALMQLLRERR